VPVDYLSIGAIGVNAFAGINGPYLTDRDGDGTDEVNELALGFSLTNVNFGIVFMKRGPPADGSTPTDLRSWTAVTAQVGGFEFVGIGDLGINISVSNLALKLNTGGGKKDGEPNTTAVDFIKTKAQNQQAFTIQTDDSGSSIEFLFDGEHFGIEATVTLNVFDFFFASGSFAFEKTEDDVLLSSGELLKVDLLTVGAIDVSAFAGVNGPYDPNASDSQAMGFYIEDVEFALAFIKPAVSPDIATNPEDKRTWTSLKAEVGTAQLVGIDNINVTVDDFYVGINTGGGSFGGIPNTSFINFKSLSLDVNTGDGNSLTLDFDSDILQAYGTITLEIYDFFFVTGSFAFTKKSMTVTLNDGTPTSPASKVDVEVLTLGAADVSAFAGVNGPGDNEGAMGFLLEDIDFALALMKRTKDPAAPNDTRSWMALEASVRNVSIVGIEGITISMEDFAIDLNQAGGTNDGAPNEDVVDYAVTDLEVETGAEPLKFDFIDELLEARGTVSLAVYGFFYVAGSFAFEKKSAKVTLADTAEPVDVRPKSPSPTLPNRSMSSCSPWD